MNAVKVKALQILKLWAIPHIMGRDVGELIDNLSDDFVLANRRALTHRNVARVIIAVADGNGMKVS